MGTVSPAAPPHAPYGPERLRAELEALGHAADLVAGTDGLQYAVVPGYHVAAGRFAGRAIDLGIPALPNFPLAVGSSIHVRAEPQLLEYGTVQGAGNVLVHNVIASPLGPAWRYWSKNFNWPGEQERSAARLMRQINAVFAHA